ncbi:MAG: hypothetical protein JWL90_2091 [Chthoniobacteraceae bacterium]|nr:hypothetical protein [Chthoniobacteraceae bacterium]
MKAFLLVSFFALLCMKTAQISPPGTAAALAGMISNIVLAGIKVTAGILGNSYHLSRMGANPESIC